MDLTHQLICYYLFLLAFLSFLLDFCCHQLSAVLNQFGGKAVIEAGLIEHAQITIWHIPRHKHLQTVNQLQETGTRRRIFIPAFAHQFISIVDKETIYLSGWMESSPVVEYVKIIGIQDHPRIKPKSNYLHFITTHIRPFHAISSLQKSTQLWIGQCWIRNTPWKASQKREI